MIVSFNQLAKKSRYTSEKLNSVLLSLVFCTVSNGIHCGIKSQKSKTLFIWSTGHRGCVIAIILTGPGGNAGYTFEINRLQSCSRPFRRVDQRHSGFPNVKSIS